MNPPTRKNDDTVQPKLTTATRQRPKWLRALGHRQAPENIRVGGHEFNHLRTFKHDSWAATAMYECHDRVIVCKFNRQQSVFGIPGRWIGLILAKRERDMLVDLHEIPNVPNHSGPIEVNGKIERTAVAHEFIKGEPLSWSSRVDDHMWSTLRQTVTALHERNIAYVDLHKLENIIIDEQGQPHLIDFQISVKLPGIWPLSTLLGILQKSDLYHLDKHEIRMGPDPDATINRPWWIRAHRLFAVPFRSARRRMLTTIGVRTVGGRAATEQFVEEGLRRKADPENQTEKKAA